MKKATNTTTLEITPASGTTKGGLPILGKAQLPPGFRGAYCANGEIFFYGARTAPKGEVQDLQAIVTAVLAALGK